MSKTLNATFNPTRARENRRHNEEVYSSLKPGDLIQFPRVVISHWAVYLGNGNVAHVAPVSEEKIEICIENFWDVVEDSKARINNERDKKQIPFPPQKIVQRARSRLGTVEYNILENNCEHFAKWCRYGEKQSGQVDTLNLVKGAAIAAGVGGLLFLGLRAAARNRARREQEEEEDEDED